MDENVTFISVCPAPGSRHVDIRTKLISQPYSPILMDIFTINLQDIALPATYSVTLSEQITLALFS